jgi:DNA topoisomerase-3
MEGAGKLIDDDELREAMAEKGLGTPATRAAIIEGLLIEKYMLPRGRDLIPTAKAFQLMTLLRGLAIEDLTKPELTGNWEYQLSEMEHGRLGATPSWPRSRKMAERIVRKAKEYDRDTIPGDYATLATRCPNCGGVVKENYRRFACTGPRRQRGGLRLLDHQDPGRPRLRDRRGRGLPARQEDRPAGGLPLQGRLALHRRAQAGARRRDRNWKLEFDFGETPRRPKATASRSTSRRRRAWAPAPSAKGHVYEHGTQLRLRARGRRAVTCDFKSGKIILQQPVPREEMTRLLATGKTACWRTSSPTRRAASSRPS